jgi:hypothetical protein
LKNKLKLLIFSGKIKPKRKHPKTKLSYRCIWKTKLQ